MLLVSLAGVVIGCHESGREKPPVLLSRHAEAPEGSSVSLTASADNSRCYVCHINYDGEELVADHAIANIGCEKCHGFSYAHCNDEANVTPPDTMYAREKVNPSCLSCHPAEKLTDVHKPVLTGTAEEKYCTDCHGQHRLPRRSHRWDKTTGKLLKTQ